MTSYVTMYDATHANVAHIPADAQKVAGYITGSPDIQWTPEDWARFPHAGHVQIDQGYGTGIATGQHDVHVLKVIDSEPGAFTASGAAALVHARVKDGIQYTTIYCDRNDAPKMVPALLAADPAHHRWYIGHVHLWLAAPGLTDAEAKAIIGTEYHGLLCRAVQNQNAGAYDVSVTAADWYPAPAPVTPHLVSVEVTAKYSDGSTKRSVV